MHTFSKGFRILMIIVAICTIIGGIANFFITPLLNALSGLDASIASAIAASNVRPWVYIVLGILGILIGAVLIWLAIKEQKVAFIAMWVLAVAVAVINIAFRSSGVFPALLGLVFPIIFTIVIFAKKYWAEMK